MEGEKEAASGQIEDTVETQPDSRVAGGSGDRRRDRKSIQRLLGEVLD